MSKKVIRLTESELEKIIENQLIKEELSQKEIDNILDKISTDGINSLSDVEKRKLDNFNNPNYNFRNEIIDNIKHLIEKSDGWVTMADMQSDTSPVYQSIGQEIHLIERLQSDSVNVVIYSGYKYDTESGDYNVPYEKLDNSTLMEIKELLDNYIKD